MPDAQPDAQPDQSLHLPSLVIKNFRGIDELTIPRLGRVTLLAGKNGVGKTTVLDAVRMYAARSRARVMSDVLISRDEFVDAVDSNGEEVGTPDWLALFWGRDVSTENTISIGPGGEGDALQISVAPLSGSEIAEMIETPTDLFIDEPLLGLRVTFNDRRYTIPASYVQDHRNVGLRYRVRLTQSRVPANFTPPDDILCNIIGPTLPDNSTIEQSLDSVALTPDEQSAIDALNLVSNNPVERVAAVGPPTVSGRRILVKEKNKAKPVPLRSLGDGAVRMFGTALALAKSSGGFLLIDEVENGIHHSVQAKFWKMVLKTAQRNNVQVLATTHSWDALRGFSRALTELEMGDKDGVLYRIQKNLNNFRAVEYDKRELEIITSSGIEAR